MPPLVPVYDALQTQEHIVEKKVDLVCISVRIITLGKITKIKVAKLVGRSYNELRRICHSLSQQEP
jgi:hypothetical protein